MRILAGPHQGGQTRSGRSPTKFTKASGGEGPPISRLTVTPGHSGVGAKPCFDGAKGRRGLPWRKALMAHDQK